MASMNAEVTSRRHMTENVAPGSVRHSGFVVGTVRHRRHRPKPNSFRYRSYHAFLDVEEISRLASQVRGFSHNRPNVVSFYDRDHFERSDEPVRDKLASLLASRGKSLPAGPLFVVTNLRVVGQVFNPVSWWLCYDQSNALRIIVAEVNNTFGDAISYVLDDLQPIGRNGLRSHADKAMHVSPFLPTESVRYAFTFDLDERRVLAHIAVTDNDGMILDATQTGGLRPFTTGMLLRLLITHPMMPLRTVALIHLQALVLWFKRTPFYRRPNPPELAHRKRGQ